MNTLTEEKIDELVGDAPSWAEIIDISDVVCITGMKRYGKSALLYKLLDDLGTQYNKKISCFNISEHKKQFFPTTYTHFDCLDDIYAFNNFIVGLDEIHLGFSARKFMSNDNNNFTEMITFSGQNNQLLLLATLNNALIDINTFRICNPILVYKRVGILQSNSERTSTKEFTKIATNEWKKIPAGRKNTPERSMESKLSYVICDNYKGWMKNDIPLWWSQNASEMHAYEVSNSLVEKYIRKNKIPKGCSFIETIEFGYNIFHIFKDKKGKEYIIKEKRVD